MTVIPHWLTKQASLAPEQLAIETDDGKQVTFAELKQLSQSYAKRLAGIGVKQGSHVGLFSGNEKQMIVLIHALSYLDAVIVMLNTRLTARELTYQLTDAEVDLVLVSDALNKDFQQKDLKVKYYAFSDIEKLAEKDVTLKSEIYLDDPYTIMYTSGTTGKPKGVVHTYGNHWFSAIGSALNLGIHDTDKWLTTLPIFHVGGLSVFLKSVIYGMDVYFIKKFSERIMIHEIMY